MITLGLMRLGNGIGEGNVQGDPSAMERLFYYKQVWGIFERSPLFGSGIASFGYLANGTGPGGYPHNMIFEILIQSGMIGLLLFAMYALPVFLRGVGYALQKPASWTTIFSICLFLSAFVRHQVSMTITTAKFLFFPLGSIVAMIIANRLNSEAAARRDV
jgi:O-antigen ligase